MQSTVAGLLVRSLPTTTVSIIPDTNIALSVNQSGFEKKWKRSLVAGEKGARSLHSGRPRCRVDRASAVPQRIHLRILASPVSFLVTKETKSDQILGPVMAEAAPPLDMMDLKTLRSPTDLATPTIAL